MNHVKSATICLAIVISFFSCEKDINDQPLSEGAVEFIVNSNFLFKDHSLKSEFLSDVASALISIQTDEGMPTLYTSKSLTVRNMNGNFYVQKIALPPGNYILTGLLLLDEKDNTIFASPVEDAELSPYVENPVPINFTVVTNFVSPVNVQVLATYNINPIQFGLINFLEAEIPLFGFNIKVIDSVSKEIIPALLKVTSRTYTFEKVMDSLNTNYIVIRDAFLNYTLSLSKYGYISKDTNYPVDSLKLFSDSINDPLLIELAPLPTSVSDIEGNTYTTTIIGDQVWMAENLKTTRLNNGIEIPLITSDAEWESLDQPRYCYYDNDSASYAETYGGLYNWATVATDKLCPEGWHVPTKEEWDALFEYIGPSNISGKMREPGTAYWITADPDATNESGFNALPAGARFESIGFIKIGESAYWWSSTEDEFFVPWAHAPALLSTYLYYDSHRMENGFSVRCLKD